MDIRLNSRKLELTVGEDYATAGSYASITFWGDVHLGHPACDLEKAKHNLQFAIDHRINILLMGDLLECATRSSVGDGVYQQKLNPQDQMDEMIEILRPAVDAGLVIGSHGGNHEYRTQKDTGIDVMKIICKALKIPYLGSACWNLLRVGMQKYTIYSLHGASGSRYFYTKLKALSDIAHNFRADVLAMGHTHELAVEAITEQYVDLRGRTVKETKKYLVLTGSYLKYDDTYAQAHGYPMGKTGSPTIKLEMDKHRIHYKD
jgi:UDP-2,3-diacylglucosamine pyrophosphatase LpxH